MFLFLRIINVISSDHDIYNKMNHLITITMSLCTFTFHTYVY